MMQGYESLSKLFGVDDSWKVCLIEPNKECHKEIISKIENRPNIKLYPIAIDSTEGSVKFVRTKDAPTDIAGTICGKEWLTAVRMKFNLITDTTEEYEVGTKPISCIMDDYPDHAFWLKLDCEGKEYDILESLDLTKYDVRAAVVEFHLLTESDVRRKQGILDKFRCAGIPLHEWN